MPITPKDVAYTARLARLELTADEVERFGRDLARITEYVQVLSQAASGDDAETQVLPLIKDAEALRDDQVTQWFNGHTVVETAPDSKGEFFRVPKVIG